MSASDAYLRASTYYRVAYFPLFAAFAELSRFELSSVADHITCPVLLTAAEGDPLAAEAPKLFDAVGAERKELVRFTAAEGAGGHCEGLARTLYHQRVFDWLDETLGGRR